MRRPDRLVTEGVLRDGRSFYTRSDRTGAHWATVLLAGEPDQAGALEPRRRAASAPASPLPGTCPERGRLTGLVERDRGPPRATRRALPAGAPVRAARRGAAAQRVRRRPAPARASISAARTLVTAEHVVAGCARVTLADGTRAGADRLRPRPRRRRCSRAPGAASHWLSLAEAEPRLGQRVHAAGFPYYGIAGTSLNLTGGNVSALAGVDDDRRFFTFSAPVQPGNSGGPLIDARGAVLGLVVARLSEDYIVEATGSLPQNVNYALGEAELARFLRQHGVGARRRRPRRLRRGRRRAGRVRPRRRADRLPLIRLGGYSSHDQLLGPNRSAKSGSPNRPQWGGPFRSRPT